MLQLLEACCALKKTCVNTNLPTDTRRQVLHDQAVLSAHRRRVSTRREGIHMNTNTSYSSKAGDH